MLKIRLTRVGKKKQPSYRIVVADHKKAVKGKYIEILGHFNPLTEPKTIILKEDRIRDWLKKGALVSDRIAKILIKSASKELVREFKIDKIIDVLKKKPKKAPKTKEEKPKIIPESKEEKVQKEEESVVETKKESTEEQPEDKSSKENSLKEEEK